MTTSLITPLATRKAKPRILHHLGRSVNAHNAELVYHRIQSGANEYLVTLYQGRVCSCNLGEEPCRGHYYFNHCRHGDFALQVEHRRLEQLSTAQAVAPLILGTFATDLLSHAADEVKSCSCCGRPTKNDGYCGRCLI